MSTDLVAIRAPTAAGFVRAWDQVWASGNAVLPLDPSAPESHAMALIRRMRPALLLTAPPGHQDRLRTVRLANAAHVPSDTALVVGTSGTTGRPKGVLLSHEAVQAGVRSSVERLAAVDGDRWLLCLPWHHVAGLAVVLRSRLLGTEPVLLDRFDPEAVARFVAGDEVQWVSLVPSQLARLLDAEVPLDRLRGVLLGGAAATPELLERAREADVRVVTSYGMTETFGGCVYDGHPLEGTSAAVLPDGRVRLSGPTVAGGYHLDPLATEATFGPEGFTTSDLGIFDEEGLLRVLGRMDQVIVSGGENVPSEAVRTRALSHPDVRDAAVVGLDDEDWGQVVGLAIVTDGASPSLDELRDHVAEKLPRAWAPRRLAILDEIPRTGLGKVNGLAVRRGFG